MNHIVAPPRLADSVPVDIEAARWQARVDLAAAHRLCVMNGFNEGIFNHLTFRVPGTDDRYLQIPFGLHWSEVTASCFMEVGYDGTLLSGEGEIERSAYGIHAPVHEHIDLAAAVFHTHMPYASALTRLDDPRILPIGQTEVGMMRHVVYDEDYQGPADCASEGHRLVGILNDAPGKTVMFMANHGILTIGKTVAAAFDRLYYVERVAQVQLFAMWTQKPLKLLPQSVIDVTMETMANSKPYGTKSNAEHHFAALKRILDRKEPDYKN